MGQIKLEGMTFYAHHGYYTEERRRGMNYELDLSIDYDVSKAGKSDELEDTINYEILYKICHQEMDTPQHLIETVAYNIVHQIKEQFPDISSIELTIKKIKPELGGPVKNAQVTYKI